MTGQEYKEFQKLGSIDKIIRMNGETIKFDKEKNV